MTNHITLGLITKVVLTLALALVATWLASKLFFEAEIKSDYDRKVQAILSATGDTKLKGDLKFGRKRYAGNTCIGGGGVLIYGSSHEFSTVLTDYQKLARNYSWQTKTYKPSNGGIVLFLNDKADTLTVSIQALNPNTKYLASTGISGEVIKNYRTVFKVDVSYATPQLSKCFA